MFKKTTPTTTSAVQVNPSVADKVTNKSGDTTLPEIKFLFPLNGETAHRNGTGIINASVEATDNVGVDRVEINAGAGGSIVKMTKRVYYPYAAELNTTAEQIGQTISLVATAYDKAGNQRSASISFTLEKYNNPAEYYGLIATLNKVVIDSALKALGGSLPSFKFLEPTASQIVSGTVHVRGELLADPTHVDKVEVSIDSETPKDLHAPFEFDWDTTKVTNGNHSISAQIFLYDASSLPKIEHPVGVNNPPPPDTTSPEIEITSPASEDTVKGTIQINVNATDEGGIAKVEITPGEDNPPVTLTSA
ncbi:MAG: hypothetical protein EXS63_09665, partial [Candidatus Omnitrophica bacterium]|nr:hypothetical protein [Candidatus Omnitrophota bacterium]